MGKGSGEDNSPGPYLLSLHKMQNPDRRRSGFYLLGSCVSASLTKRQVQSFPGLFSADL